MPDAGAVRNLLAIEAPPFPLAGKHTTRATAGGTMSRPGAGIASLAGDVEEGLGAP
jgi:hypothetical protein